MKIRSFLRTALGLLPLTLWAQRTFDVALIGDMPYGAAAEPLYERVIADINSHEVSLTAHIGDTKSGSTRCDDSHYQRSLAWFNSFQSPVLYSVGDNEWTDCMRSSNGAFDPLGRLDMVRKTYFTTNMSLGKNPVALRRQSDMAGFSLYRENAMLIKGRVLFVTLHIPGSNNNLEYKLTQGNPNPFYDNDKEYTARNAANLAWLKAAFETARDQDLFGVMLLVQANMFEAYGDTSTGSAKSGFADFIKALREEVRTYIGQVVMVSGDTHYMRVDKPLTLTYPDSCAPPATATGPCPAVESAGRILNFTRVEVPGSSDVHWVLCRVRPNRKNPFQFQFMVVPENQ
ncbi:MAG: hypothetical protein U0Q16_05805 [Bryobacteraceae bacterium]